MTLRGSFFAVYDCQSIKSNAKIKQLDIKFDMKKDLTSGFNQLKLRHLHFLVKLAELGNLGRTADEMAMSQPAASRLLLEMESRFGRPLFERSRHGVRLLPEAVQALRFAKMVCAEEQMVKSAMSGPNNRMAPLRIGALPTIPGLLIEAIRWYKHEHPTSTISLRQGTLDVLLPPLLDGELDLVVGRFDPLLLQPRLQYERLLEEPLVVVAGSGHPLVQQRQITSQDLSRYPWVSPIRTSSQYPHFAGLFAGLPLPQDTIECASPQALHAFLKDGLRLALLGASVLDQPIARELKRLPVVLRSSPGPLGVYRVTGRLIPAEVSLFCGALMTEAMRSEPQSSVLPSKLHNATAKHSINSVPSS
ncbi:MAG: LysR family transcriptional regulator [Polaromonas sp.]|nr:LysR family transcriptional regulator [Polaromonas sp.]